MRQGVSSRAGEGRVGVPFVVACVLTTADDGQVQRATRTFSTMTDDLLALLDWLTEAGRRALLEYGIAPPGPRPVFDDQINPDPIAYRDDLAQIADVLAGDDQGGALDYITQFLGGVARSAGDHPLSDAVDELAASRMAGSPHRTHLTRLAAMVQQRLAPMGPL